jgi:hypothetical protein
MDELEHPLGETVLRYHSNATSKSFFVSELGSQWAFVMAAAAWADADGATRPLDGTSPEPAAGAFESPSNCSDHPDVFADIGPSEAPGPAGHAPHDLRFGWVRL